MLCLLLIILFIVIIAGSMFMEYKANEEVIISLLISPIVLFIGALSILPLVHISLGERIYTGYIYSAEDQLGKTVGHIRFSETAGEDAQPSFCVKSGTEKSEQLKSLAGSGKKVKVSVPAGFAIADFYWSCPIEATVEEVRMKPIINMNPDYALLDARETTLGYLLRLDANYKKKGVAYRIETEGNYIKVTKEEQ